MTSTFLFTANLHGQGVEADVPPIYLLLPLPSSQGTKISFTSCLISLLVDVTGVYRVLLDIVRYGSSDAVVSLLRT